jgi:hypothetical protein
MILYGIIALALAGALGGAYFTGHQNGIKEQTAVDEPVIAVARAERQTAIGANEGLQRDLVTIRGDVAACNAKVDSLKAGSDVAVAALGKIQAEAEERKRGYAAMLAKFQAGARPSVPVAADKQCEAARATLADLSGVMTALDALGLGKAVTAPVAPKLTIEPTKAPPKSAIKTLPGVK